MAGLLGDMQSLVPKCMIQQNGNATEAVGKEVMEELAAASEELSAMPPSLSEDSTGNSVNNWSTGTQNVNTGKGTQNNNTGAGMQYIGHTDIQRMSPNASTQKDSCTSFEGSVHECKQKLEGVVRSFTSL